MSASKFLSDAGWKDIASKNKIKDNGLLKALADHKRLDPDKHDQALDSLDEIIKLAAQLKKAKDVVAASAALKYIGELTNAAEGDRRAAVKAKADAGKSAEAEARKRQDEEKKSRKGEDEGEEEEDSSELLTTKMVPLLRQVKKGEMMHALIASTGKQVVVLLSRKQISPARRKLLADELGVSGGVKYFVGHCLQEEGMATFVLKTQVAGLAKKLKLALLEQTGMRVNLRCRGEDGDTDEDLDEPARKGSESRNRGDQDDDEEKGGDDEEKDDDTPDFVPGVEVPAASPELAKAPNAWEGTRDLLKGNIDALKEAVQAQIGDEGDDVIDEIEGHLQKLDRIFVRLDKRLGASLAYATEARDAAGRKAALQESKAILADYIRYVRSEPLIEHLDNNPFGVDTDLKATLLKSLTQMARAIG